MKNEIVKEAKALQEEWTQLRRQLHQNAETGFALHRTINIVEDTLKGYGYTPQTVGKGSVTVTLGQGKRGKAILLRADMDGLPIQEKTGAKYACKTGNMHACGHDMHTTALLGAAKLLKERETRLNAPVKLLFQAAEETLEGAEDAVKAGVLQAPDVGGAVMLHVMTGVALPTGTLVIPSAGAGAPACDYFTVTVRGKACHGSAPQNGVDALTAAARILLDLEELSARELPAGEPFVLTVGKMQAGVAGNALPDTAVMQGTIRAFDEDVRAFAKKRLQEIVVGVAKTFRAKGELAFMSGCPVLQNDEGTCLTIGEKLQQAFGKDGVKYVHDLSGGALRNMGGSEDFAYIAKEVPSVMLALAAGEPKDGFAYPLHHPKADFDERVLPIGVAAYTLSALAFAEK